MSFGDGVPYTVGAFRNVPSTRGDAAECRVGFRRLVVVRRPWPRAYAWQQQPPPPHFLWPPPRHLRCPFPGPRPSAPQEKALDKLPRNTFRSQTASVEECAFVLETGHGASAPLPPARPTRSPVISENSCTHPLECFGVPRPPKHPTGHRNLG